MIRVVFDPSTPGEIESAVRSAMERLAHLVPGWCHEIYVAYAGDMGSTVAQMTVRFEYRRADLDVGGHFVLRNASERLEVLRHELLHLPIGPMQKAYHDLVEQLPRGARDAAREAWRMAMEGAVSDLEEALNPVSEHHRRPTFRRSTASAMHPAIP
jgi:hypothetical protein